MREWQVGGPVGDGNNIGVPDTKYMDYLKNNQRNEWADALYDAYNMWESLERIDEYLSIANKNSNDYARGINLKGCILDKLGKDTEALNCFDEALKISPNDKTFQKKIRKDFLYILKKSV